MRKLASILLAIVLVPVDHIVSRYHSTLREEVPRLRRLAVAVAVAVAHGENHPELSEVADVFGELADEILAHLDKEERVLFPCIRSGGAGFLPQPVACMEREHSAHGERLERLRRLTNDYRAPEEACASWHALCLGLEEFARDLREHVHLENNLLFPRALCSPGVGGGET